MPATAPKPAGVTIRHVPEKRPKHTDGRIEDGNIDELRPAAERPRPQCRDSRACRIDGRKDFHNRNTDGARFTAKLSGCRHEPADGLNGQLVCFRRRWMLCIHPERRNDAHDCSVWVYPGGLCFQTFTIFIAIHADDDDIGCRLFIPADIVA